MKRWFALLLSACFSTIVYAANISIYSCPSTFKTVRLGDSMDVVRAACGDPTTISTKQQQVVTPVNSTQWIYTLGLIQGRNIAIVLPTLTLVFINNKVSSIAKSGFPISTTGYCNITGIVNIGDTMDKILFTCGQPNYINSVETGVTSNKNLTDWLYNHGIYQPQIIFTFDDNNKVVQITSGQLGN